MAIIRTKTTMGAGGQQLGGANRARSGTGTPRKELIGMAVYPALAALGTQAGSVLGKQLGGGAASMLGGSLAQAFGPGTTPKMLADSTVAAMESLRLKTGLSHEDLLKTNKEYKELTDRYHMAVGEQLKLTQGAYEKQRTPFGQRLEETLRKVPVLGGLLD